MIAIAFAQYGPTGNDPAQLVQTMREQDIWADCRGTTRRMSAGHVTTTTGVRRVLALLAGLTDLSGERSRAN